MTTIKLFVTRNNYAKEVFGFDWGLWLTDNLDYAKQFTEPLFTVELNDDVQLLRFDSYEQFERARNCYADDLMFVKSVLDQGYQGVIFYRSPWVSGQDIALFDSSLLQSLKLEWIE